MHELTKPLLAAAGFGANKCTILAVLLNISDSGITKTEAGSLFNQPANSLSTLFRKAVDYRWIYSTAELRERAVVYKLTHAGQQVAIKICQQ